MLAFFVILLVLFHLRLTVVTASTYRNVPGDPGFPSNEAWTALNTSIGGKLVPVVPSAKYCQINNCTTTQRTSLTFRVNHMPGAMNQVSPFHLGCSCYLTRGYRSIGRMYAPIPLFTLELADLPILGL